MTHSLIFYPALYSFWEEQLIQQHEDIPAPLINSVPLRRHRFVGVSKPTPVERHPFVVLAGAHCHEEQANIEEALRALAQARKATSSSNLVRACECLREAYIKPPYLSSLYELYNQCTQEKVETWNTDETIRLINLQADKVRALGNDYAAWGADYGHYGSLEYFLIAALQHLTGDSLGQIIALAERTAQLHPSAGHALKALAEIKIAIFHEANDNLQAALIAYQRALQDIKICHALKKDCADINWNITDLPLPISPALFDILKAAELSLGAIVALVQKKIRTLVIGNTPVSHQSEALAYAFAEIEVYTERTLAEIKVRWTELAEDETLVVAAAPAPGRMGGP